MAVSVAHFGTSSPHKVLQQNTTNNNNSNDRREIIILRKNPHILPQPKDFSKEDVLISNPARPKSKSGKEIRTQPQPVAVARRNARERNRVKQVNNGFANLRQHIPNFIASAFESSTRGGSKKLSKVETLRMAVEYIRSLEDVLAVDGGENGNTSNTSNLSSPSHSSLHTLPSYPLLSPSCDSDDLSTTSTPPPSHQYIRIDTATNTYQIISGHHPHNLIYNNGGNHNNENLDPISDDIIMSDPSLIDADFGAEDLSLLNSINGGDVSDSLSPGMYSEQSLSPCVILDKHSNQQNFIAVFHNQNGDFKVEHIKSEVIDNEVPVISLKTENELPQEHKDNVIDVMQWWEHQAPNDTLS